MKPSFRFKSSQKDTSDGGQSNDFGLLRGGRWKNWPLVFILLIAALFRFYGLNWDQGFHFHPDERMIVMVAEKIQLPQPLTLKTIFSPESSLNPKFFPYGSFPLYWLRFSGWAMSHFDPKWAHYGYLHLLGRMSSVLADLGSTIIIWLIGRKVFSSKVGLTAALFYTLSVFPIQAAHFYAVDTLLCFFTLATLYRLILLYEKNSAKNAVLVGVFFGLSLATKVSSTVLITAVGTALTVDLFLIFLKRIRQVQFAPRRIRRELLALILWSLSALKTPKREKLFRFVFLVFRFGIIIAVSSLATFSIFEPYAWFDWPTFWRQTQEQHQMTKSAYTFPYTLQYVGTIPYLYHLKNLILWGMGIPLGALSVVALLWLVGRLVVEVPRPGHENQEAKMLILATFTLVYFGVVGRFSVKFMRYLLPLYPLFCLFAAWFLSEITPARWLRSRPRKFLFNVPRIALAVSLGLTFLWTFAFISIYSQSNTRVLATQWFEQNVPAGDKIAVEHWDDRVPMSGNYQFLEMPLYEPDNSPKKWQQVRQNLAQADFLVLASDRLYVPLQRLADCHKYERCYPKTAKYYQDLFAGRLGFRKIAEFTSYPSLSLISQYLNISISFPDDSADESFTVYDHPKIIIFQKI